MYKKILFPTLILIIFFNIGKSQLFPDNGILYNDFEICVVKIEIAQDSLDELLMPGNEDSYHEYPARFIFSSSAVTDTFENVGFRLRGNTSRYSQKKSFKVSLNTFVGGRKYQGVEKINLNGEHNDPSIIRSKISWDLFKNLGVPAPRSSHIELFINGEYKGLYMNVEHIDEEFCESRFGNKNGNLYKCLWPATLEYISSNPDDYKFTTGDRRAYDLRTNTEIDDYTDLANFIDILNNTPANDLHTELEPVFNVNSYLKYLSIEILTGHWDAYSFNKNNFYLYHNQQTDKFEFIPYDPDNTFGIDWFGIDWALRNIYDWTMGGEYRPLTERLLDNQVYRDRFSFFIEKTLTEYFDPVVIFPYIDDIKSMIITSAENDVYRTYDYGWSIQDFHDSYTQALGSHVTYGLKPYITARYNSADNQLNVNSVAPVISHVQFTNLFINRDMEFFAMVDDEDASPDVVLHYKINSGSVTDLVMVDDGTSNDRFAEDRIYSAVITTPMSAPGTFEFNVTAEDDEMNTSYEPINGMYLIVIPEASEIELSINEFMASNSSTIRDDFGEFDDWVELYNHGSEIVWLGNKYLSDDRYNPSKWQMPDVEIHPGDFILFWTDNDTEQGDYHASFKLSAGGEEIGIYDSPEYYFAEIDFVEFGVQESDITTGRLPDGTGAIQILPWPTPGYTNYGDPYVNINSLSSEFKVYPNPFIDFITVEFANQELKDITVSVSEITGRLVSQKTYYNISSRLDINNEISALNNGTFLLSIIGNEKISGKNFVQNKLIIKN